MQSHAGDGSPAQYLEEAIQCSQGRVSDEVKLEAVQHIQLIAQHALAVLPHQAAELVSANVRLLNLQPRTLV